MRRLVFPLLFALLAVPLAGCGASDTVSQSFDPVAAAATKTSRVSTTHMSLTATMSAPGVAGSLQFTGSGAIDNARRRGSMTPDMSGIAQSMPAAGGVKEP